jgi:hypothetical protein
VHPTAGNNLLKLSSKLLQLTIIITVIYNLKELLLPSHKTEHFPTLPLLYKSLYQKDERELLGDLLSR